MGNGFFSRLKEGLAKTRQGLVGRVTEVLSGHGRIDEELYEELEEALIAADVGVPTAMNLIEELRERVRRERPGEPDALRVYLREAIADLLGDGTVPLAVSGDGPTVVLVVGVNGTGKTTTVGKLAAKLRGEGKKVLIAAADTFRAAAIDQLEVWANRAGAHIVRHREGSDAAAVVYDAIQAARSRGVDYLLVDTAGRLHTKANLMEELKKVSRVISREMPGAPHEVLLVVDATTGQNAVQQARLFGESAGVTGVVLTKLDGTAKGGVVIAIKAELDLPVKLVGIGEKVEDLREFDPGEFVKALFD